MKLSLPLLLLLPNAASGWGWYCRSWCKTDSICPRRPLCRLFDCCGGEDADPPVAPNTICTEPLVDDNQGDAEYDFDLGMPKGKFQVKYNMMGVNWGWPIYKVGADSLDIFHEGRRVFSTDGRVTGEGQEIVEYGLDSSTETKITVKVDAVTQNSDWSVEISCPLA